MTRDDVNRLDPAALRDILKSNNDQVVLVPRGEWDDIRGSQVERLSTASPAVVLPFSWKELAARLWEFVRDSNISPESQVVPFDDVRVDFTKMKVSEAYYVRLGGSGAVVWGCFCAHAFGGCTDAQVIHNA